MGAPGDVFTPAAAGQYYLLYRYTDGSVTAESYYRIATAESGSVSWSLAFDGETPEEGTVGVQAELYIPEGRVESALLTGGAPVYAAVTIEKDGAALEGYTDVAGGFSFTFEEAGEYTVVYSTDVFGTPESKTYTVTVSGDVATVLLDELPEQAGYNETLFIEPARVYYGGEEIVADVTLTYPSGRTVQGTEAVLDEAGNYTVTHAYSYGGNSYTKTQGFRVLYVRLRAVRGR